MVVLVMPGWGGRAWKSQVVTSVTGAGGCADTHLWLCQLPKTETAWAAAKRPAAQPLSLRPLGTRYTLRPSCPPLAQAPTPCPFFLSWPPYRGYWAGQAGMTGHFFCKQQGEKAGKPLLPMLRSWLNEEPNHSLKILYWVRKGKPCQQYSPTASYLQMRCLC